MARPRDYGRGAGKPCKMSPAGNACAVVKFRVSRLLVSRAGDFGFYLLLLVRLGACFTARPSAATVKICGYSFS